MSNTITLKKSGVSGNAPASGDLSLGEIAINYADGHLYYKSGASATPAKIKAGDADTTDGFHLNQDVRSTASPTFNGVTASNLYLGSSSVRISPGGSGEIGLNYNTSATGSLNWYGGGTASKFSVTNAGDATFAGDIVASGKVLVNGAEDNSGKADFAVSGGTVLSFRNNQVQMGGSDMNWNSKIFDDGQAKWSAWDRNIEISSTGSNTGSATARDIIFSPQTSGSAASTERMRIKGSGNVGIGTTSPTGQLESIAPDGNKSSLRLGRSDTSIIWDFNHAGGDLRIWNSAASGSDILLGVDSGGTVKNNNVGIGTASPSTKLHINAGSTNSVAIFESTDATSRIALKDNSGEVQIAGIGDNLTFNTSSSISERMRITSAGNVGIGTTSPTTTLDVNSGTANKVATFTSTDATAFIQVSDSNTTSTAHGYGVNGNNLSLYANDSERMRIDSSGNVGIGTTNPLNQFVVAEATNQHGIEIIAGTLGYIQAYDRATSDYGDLKIDAQTIRFGTDNGSERVRIDSAGKVGIGTDSPDQKLVVATDQGTTFSDAFLALKADTVTDTVGRTAISLATSPVNNYGVTLNGIRHGSSSGEPRFGINMHNNSAGGVEALSIRASGNVGIGTTSPNAKLELKGSTADSSENAFVARDSASASLFSIRNDGRVDATGDLVVGGNLTVSGDTTIINTETLQVEDHNIELGNVASPTDTTADGGGITLKGAADKTIKWINSTGAWTFSERIAIPDGTAAAPALTFTSDTDTGMYRPATNELGFATSGTLALTVDSSQNIEAVGSVTAYSFIKDGGTNSEFLKADGGVDSSTYLTTSSASSTYLPLAGGTITGNVKFNDGVELRLGAGADLKIYHNSNVSRIHNELGDLYIENDANDGDIIFGADNGSGGIGEYFRLDGSQSDSGSDYRYTRWQDYSVVALGSNNDLQLFHTGTNSYISNYIGDLLISNNNDDGDIIFRSDDGSGGLAEYFRLDGGLGYNVSSQNLRIADGKALYAGNGNDLGIYHYSSNSYIQNITGDLIIQNDANDKDIVFQSDDGSGGVTPYLTLDGSSTGLTVSAPQGMVFFDNIKAKFGNNDDLQIFHDGSHSYIHNDTGNIYIENDTTDGDIFFKSDNGSGGLATYLKLDGGTTTLQAYKDLLIANDTAKIKLGASQDLQIYHDGQYSYIDQPAGLLRVSAPAFEIVNAAKNAYIARFLEGGNGTENVQLYYSGAKKFETTTSGVSVTGGADAIAVITGTTTAARLDLKTDSHHRFWQTIESDGRFRLYNQTTSVEQLTVLSGGNVGIGTASPAAKLHIDVATEDNQPAFKVTKVSDNNENAMEVYHGTSSTTRGIADFTNALGSVMYLRGDGNVGIGTTTPSAKLEVNGHFAATTKSFIIDNPKTGGKLQYGVVESNEHGVYVRGKTDQDEIELPEEWEWLVDEDSVTVDLTSIGQMQHLFIIEQTNKKVKVGGMATNGQYNYVIYGTRKDVDPLEINI